MWGGGGCKHVKSTNLLFKTFLKRKNYTQLGGVVSQLGRSFPGGCKNITARGDENDVEF